MQRIKGKNAKMNAKNWIFVVIIGLVLFGVGYYWSSMKTNVPGVTITPGGAGLGISSGTGGNTFTLQNNAISPNVVITGVDAYTKAGTTEYGVLFDSNGNLLGVKTGDSNIPLSVGTKITGFINSTGFCSADVIKGSANSDAWNNPDGSKGIVGTIPAKSPVQLVFPLTNEITDGIAGINFVKDPTQTTNTAATNYSISTNTRYPFTWTIDAQSKHGLCTAGNPVLTCLIDKGNYTLVEATVSRGSLSGGASKPTIVTQTAQQNAYSWSWDQNIADSGNPVTFNLAFTTSSAKSSGSAEPSTSAIHPFCTLNDQDIYQDQSTGKQSVGFNTENNLNVGAIANIVNATFYIK